MKKRIAVILNSEPEWGGEHQYVLTVMACLEQAEDVEVMAVCGSRFWRKWCREHKIRVWDTAWPVFTGKEQRQHIRHPLWSRMYAMYMTAFGKRLRAEKADAILCTTQGAFIPNYDRKVIVPVHDLMHRYEGRFSEVRKDFQERELVFASKAKYAWCVLTDSQTGKKQFIESYAAYMRKKLPHLVSIPFVVPGHITECEEEIIDTPAKYVFYPAQFWEHKNHINLVKAIHILAKYMPDIHLVLVGSEKNSMGKIRQYITQNGLADNITIMGFVSNGNITYLYRHAAGLVMPSYFGPTNIPPLEAMALGCPVAVSDKYAMPEQVGDAGLLFNPDSPEEIAACIRKLWCDEAMRQDMIQKGYQRIKRWTVKEFGKRLQKVIEKV